MGAMKGAAAMSKSGLVNAMIEGTEVKGSVCKQLLDNLAAVTTKEVKGVGKFTIPGLCMLKLEQAGDKGWQEGGLREGGHGEGEASIQSCEGLLCGCAEEEHLSRQPAQVLEWTFHSRVRELLGVSVC